MASSVQPSFLNADLDWILFGGKGGVGKTTCAAATALHRARHGTAPVHLLSTDPAHSIRDSLGERDRSAADDLPASLHVQEFDAERALAAFRDEHRTTLHEIVAHGTLFDDEDIGRLLDLGLPGMDEVMAFLHLADLLDDPGAGTVVVDTAPTGHTLRLLDAPAVFESWLAVLDAMLDKHRTLRATFGGAEGPDALDRFLDDMQGRADRVLSTLRDAARCSFVIVTRPEPLALAETDRLWADLQERSVPVSTVVANQYPWADDAPDASAPAAADLRLAAERWGEVSLWALPTYDEEVRHPARLERLWADAAPLDRSVPPEPRDDEPLEPPAVLRSVPSPDERLLLFAGKGGVGKTTLACATALHLASSSISVLLLSTDPAHSLATALDTALGDTPTAVVPGLKAMEVDAAARFEALRDAYVEEVRQFFREHTGAGVDLPYDRPVMEGLLDLAPPGVDEVMGWTAALDALDGEFDVCVLDAAPTGHFVRLLEMPRLFEEWLQAFFRILRKYCEVVRLPRLADRLVGLSKQTKALRRMLEVDRTGAVYGVTLPTQMAQAETKDLCAAAARLGVSVPVLVVNRVARGAADEVLADYARWGADRTLGAVAEGAPPQGVAALNALGDALYD